MKEYKIFYLILFLLVPVITFGQKDSTKYDLMGTVIGLIDTNELEGAHVLNINTLQGTITNEKGDFKIPVSIHDRILISYLGYEIDTILVTKTLVDDPASLPIYMQQTSYLLSIFKVLSIATFEEFERAFLALELPDEKIQFSMPPPEEYQQRQSNNQAFTIAIPFDLSYFTKKARDYRKYLAMLAQDEQKKVIFARYNPMVVEKVTGIKDDEQVVKLMDYCDFSDHFVRSAIDYDLYVAIIQCYQSFQGSIEEEE